MSPEGTPEKVIGYIRDAGCVLVGLGGIVFQLYTGDVSAVGMGTCMGLLGYAGAANVRQLLPSTPRRGTRGRSSSSSRPGSRSRSSASSEADE